MQPREGSATNRAGAGAAGRTTAAWGRVHAQHGQTAEDQDRSDGSTPRAFLDGAASTLSRHTG